MGAASTNRTFFAREDVEERVQDRGLPDARPAGDDEHALLSAARMASRCPDASICQSFRDPRQRAIDIDGRVFRRARNELSSVRRFPFPPSAGTAERSIVCRRWFPQSVSHRPAEMSAGSPARRCAVAPSNSCRPSRAVSPRQCAVPVLGRFEQDMLEPARSLDGPRSTPSRARSHPRS